MSSPLQAELRETASAGAAFTRSRDAVAEKWRDSVYQSIDRRALLPIITEIRHFQSSLAEVDAILDKALRLLED